MKQSFETEEAFRQCYSNVLDLPREEILSAYNAYKAKKHTVGLSSKRTGGETEKLNQFFEEIQRLLINLRKVSQAPFLNKDTTFIDMLQQLFEERKIFRETLIANSEFCKKSKQGCEPNGDIEQELRGGATNMKESLFDELKAHIIRKLESQIHELKLTVAFMVVSGYKIPSLLDFEDINTLKEKFEERKLDYDDATLEKILAELRNANPYQNCIQCFQNLKRITGNGNGPYLKIDNLLKAKHGYFPANEDMNFIYDNQVQENRDLDRERGAKQCGGATVVVKDILKENLHLYNTKAERTNKIDKISKGNSFEHHPHKDSYENLVPKLKASKENRNSISANRKTVIPQKSKENHTKFRPLRRKSPNKSCETSRVHYHPRSLDMIKETEERAQLSLRESKKLQYNSPPSAPSSKRSSCDASPAIETREWSFHGIGPDSERAPLCSNRDHSEQIPVQRMLYACHIEKYEANCDESQESEEIRGDYETAQFESQQDEEVPQAIQATSEQSKHSDSGYAHGKSSPLGPESNSPTVRRLEFSNIKNNTPDLSPYENKHELTFTMQDQAMIGSFSGPIDNEAHESTANDSNQQNNSIKEQNDISLENQKLFKVFFQKDLTKKSRSLRDTNTIKPRVDCNRPKATGLNSSKCSHVSEGIFEKNENKALQKKSKSSGNFTLEAGIRYESTMGGYLIKDFPFSPEFSDQPRSTGVENYSSGGQSSTTTNTHCSEKQVSQPSAVNMYLKKYLPKCFQGELKPVLPKKASSKI